MSKIIAHLVPVENETVGIVIFKNQLPTLIQYIAQFILIADHSKWSTLPSRHVLYERTLLTIDTDTNEFV